MLKLVSAACAVPAIAGSVYPLVWPAGTKPAAELVRDFLGRKVNIVAFLARLERSQGG